ncbi:hypothetical protein [Alloacidobacterium sp.]|uniref:hypothetical protein n=1 Tax=Alloacidobacterium sp. TaxID=2951999 RepID=UPI002D321C6D|nr:hypothetical protein [Alloacidobacterium sp.]HYK34431.1 hypothetical protein [Alloacidobacterium sp.]
MIPCKTRIGMIALFAGLISIALQAQSPKYPPLSEYMMAPEAEMALAKSAAPENVSEHATVMLLTASGYKTAAPGDNGFVCIVMRGWTAPTFTPEADRNLVYDSQLRAPICFNPVAVRTVLPYEELRTKLGMEGKSPDEIAAVVERAYVKGDLPRMEAVAFAYMFSADQKLGPAGAWHPHMMVFTPYYTDAMLGDNSGNDMLPVVASDAGTPFALTVIPVDHSLAVHARTR